jgi:hypothetical protein
LVDLGWVDLGSLETRCQVSCFSARRLCQLSRRRMTATLLCHITAILVMIS